MSADFDAAWLSAALNAPVKSFELRYAGEGQTALTFVIHSIVYGGAPTASADRPSSVAIKIHAESEPQREASVRRPVNPHIHMPCSGVE